jgi:hypothetical protein
MPNHSTSLTPNRFSNSSHRSGGQPAERTTRTGLSASSGRAGCLSRIEIMPPSALNSTASKRRQSSKNRDALNRSPRANRASSSMEPIIDTKRALPWKRGSGVYIVSPGWIPAASSSTPIGLVS